MANVVFSNATDTNLQDINQSNITDATATATTFTGAVGSTFAVDVEHGTSAISNGEVTLTTAATATYSAIKGSAGEIGFYTEPAI